MPSAPRIPSRLLLLAVCGWLAAALPDVRAQAPARPAPAAPAAASAADGPPPASYVLSTNDAVQVEVYQEDDLRTAAVISKEGTIQLPLIGSVKLSGLTATQARDLIAEKLRPDYLKNPQVSVTVVRFARKRFTVLGQVGRPGSFDFPDAEGIDLIEAIAMAGGFTRIADHGKVTVRRHSGSSDQIFNLNAKKMESDTREPRFPIEPGDSITVRESVF